MNGLKFLIKSIGLCMLFNPLWAANWQCIAQDSEEKHWIAHSGYERTASNKALELCKKESHAPSTCSVPAETCSYLAQSNNPNPTIVTSIVRTTSSPNASLWQCTALDWRARAWLNRPAPNQDMAALSAKAFCQKHSSLPETCYVNLITCQNVVR